jgi:hypothetical protein
VTVGYADMRSAEAARIPRLGLRARVSAVLEARMTSERSRGRLAEDFENAVGRAERLRAPRRVDPDGVRLARLLLHDGAGPLYIPAAPGELRAAALRVLQALDANGAGR